MFVYVFLFTKSLWLCTINEIGTTRVDDVKDAKSSEQPIETEVPKVEELVPMETSVVSETSESAKGTDEIVPDTSVVDAVKGDTSAAVSSQV